MRIPTMITALVVLQAALHGESIKVVDAGKENAKPSDSMPVKQATAQESLESLTRGIYHGKEPVGWLHIDYKKLPLWQRNEIATAAARELLLRTPEGVEIPKGIHALLLGGAKLTPTESTLRDLHWNNDHRVELLRNLQDRHLITDARVIKPLIDMLAYPGEAIPQKALQALVGLTKRSCGEVNSELDAADSERSKEVINWWRSWWAKNGNKHPVADDPELDKVLKKRITAIESLLVKDLQGYSEIRYLKPEHLRIHYIEPLVDIEVDSVWLSEGLFGRGADGSIQVRNRDDYTFIKISAEFATPLPAFDAKRRPRDYSPIDAQWQKKNLEEVFREKVPGTDILIRVEAAAAKDETFVRKVRESLAKLPHIF